MGVNPALPFRTLGHVFDSSVAAWIPDPKTGSGGGAGSTQVAVSSVSGTVAIAQADALVTGTLAANATSSVIAIAGLQGVSVTFAADTFSGATDLNTQLSYDGGTTWATGGVFILPQTATAAAVISLNGTSPGNQYTIAFNGSPTHLRLIASNSGATGSVAYTLAATAVGHMTVMLGRDGSIVRPVQVTTAGLMRIDWANNALPLAGTATLTSVAASTTSVTLLSAGSRKGMALFNDSTSALYLKFGATASTTSFTFKVFPSQTYTMDPPIYQGIIDGIWESTHRAARITELT